MHKIGSILQNGVALIVAALMLSACATGHSTKFVKEPYVAPAGQPTAKLTNALTTILEAGEIASAVAVLDDCKTAREQAQLQEAIQRQGILFDMTSADTMAGKTIDIAAGRPMLLHYIFSDGPKRSKVCFVSVVAQFEAGKNYALVGGYRTIKGAIPLTNKQGCGIGVLDIQANRILPITTELCPGN